jgi:uncharacterized protein (DUF1697 family)
MSVVVSLLRAVNLGKHNSIRMDALRTVCESLGLAHVTTYVQSGNVVFTTREPEMAALERRLEDAIETTFGFRTDVINRTSAELREVIARNPFGARDGISGSKLVVTFLKADPGEIARQQARAIPVSPEELFIAGREMYVYYPEGMGRSKLPAAAIGKALKVPGTARNWNTVTKLLAIAEAIR